MALRVLSIMLIMGLNISLAPAQEFTTNDQTLMQHCVEAVNTRQNASENVDMRDCIGAAAKICMQAPKGQTTIGMMECTMRENAWWDQHLNISYQDLKAHLSEEQFKSLQTAQRAWISYRDTKCGFEYEFWKDGTIRTLFHASCVLDATASRAIDLADYLDWMDL